MEGNHLLKIHNRNRIKGNNKQFSIGAPKLVHLHVCRINLKKSALDLQQLLMKYFPDIQYESIRVKYPNLYTSFKVIVHEENFKKSMDAT